MRIVGADTSAPKKAAIGQVMDCTPKTEIQLAVALKTNHEIFSSVLELIESKQS